MWRAYTRTTYPVSFRRFAVLADSSKHTTLYHVAFHLTGSRERLPQVGFNTMDGRQLPFPEDLPINRETLLHFCAAFLSGRLQTSLDARKAMVVSRPFSKHNTVRRERKRQAPAEVRGVSEQLKPQDAVTQAGHMLLVLLCVFAINSKYLFALNLLVK